jgi:group I intron endonuclease
MARKIICGIYRIISPTNKIYIGQSVDIRRRLNCYKSARCKGQPIIYRSILKYGWRKHKFAVLCECSKEELNDMEKYYVDLFGTFNSKNGMNLLDGGGSRATCSDETKLKMSIARMGKKHTDEYKKRMSDIHKKIIKSKEWCDNISKGKKNPSIKTRKRIGDSSRGRKAFLGRHHSDEAKIKISVAHIGKIAYNRVPIIDTKTGIIYSCKKDAANAISMKERTLKAMLNGQNKNKTTMMYLHVSHNLISKIQSPINNIKL